MLYYTLSQESTQRSFFNDFAGLGWAELGWAGLQASVLGITLDQVS